MPRSVQHQHDRSVDVQGIAAKGPAADLYFDGNAGRGIAKLAGQAHAVRAAASHLQCTLHARFQARASSKSGQSESLATVCGWEVRVLAAGCTSRCMALVP